MGYLITHVVAETEDQIWTKANEFAFYNTDRDENPNGEYHGNLTIHTEMQPFETQEEAYNYLEIIRTEYYDDHAVPFYVPVRQVSTRKIQDLQRSIEEKIAKHTELSRGSWVGYKTSSFIECPACKSKINRECLRKEDNQCPCCKSDLRPPSTLYRLSKSMSKITELREQLDDEQAKANKGVAQNIMWLVKLEIRQ